MFENDFLSNFKNRYVTNNVKIGPIVLERKFLDKSGIDDLINNESFKSPVIIAQNRIALLIVIKFELCFTCVTMNMGLNKISANVKDFAKVWNYNSVCP